MEFHLLPPHEYRRIYPLWQEAFGDREDVITAVLAAISPATCFVAEDGDVIAMLFLVPQTVGSHPTAYVYAVATAKSHRRQGIAASLLSHAEAWAKAQGLHAAILCPATEGLCTCYGKLGYKIWSEKKVPPKADPTGAAISAHDYLSLREEALKNVPHNTPKDSVLSLYAVKTDGVWDGNTPIDTPDFPASALSMYKPFTPDFPSSGIFTFPMD